MFTIWIFPACCTLVWCVRPITLPGWSAADLEATRQMPGVVDVVQDGSFLAVVAEHEAQAIHALEALQASADLGRAA